ncbi:MAG TPA: sugar phosphate isomerase/epimerase [Devosiaceae bacterium]
MHLSNAPVSWGIFYADNPRVSPGVYLDEVARAGYWGTELGPYGFLPSDPVVLAEELARRNLHLVGGVHVHAFSDPLGAPALLTQLRAAGSLLHSLGVGHYVVMDDGQPDGDNSLDDDQWRHMVRLLEDGRKLLADEFGVTLSFHPHVLTAIEFEAQIDRLLDESDIALCFDTGHHAFWGQDPLAYMAKVWDRIAYMHLKNVDGTVRQRVLDGTLDAAASFDAGAMCPLPDGVVDIAAIVRMLRERDFSGPVVVEQDFSSVATSSPFDLSVRNAKFLRSI